GLTCGTCHGRANVDFANGEGSIPGNPKWGLAPIEMAWEGKTLGQICEQIKDPARNGAMNLSQLHEHMAHDTLVGWGWSPGAEREPVPGTQQRFGELIQAWIDSGAECPSK
ncbi:MAG: Isoquinoline 1-oxidoreductase subunit, partial [Myxococcaceae bacterium]|nr:Isoquinoline 1-oxidoreductase subunit [Myxococcaceae bacterium]